MSITSSSTATGIAQLLQTQQRLAATSSESVAAISSKLSGLSSGKSVLSTSNTTIFAMANLMVRVKALSTQAGMVRESDATAVDALRRQVGDVLGQFDSISSNALTALNGAAGGLSAASASTASTSAGGAATMSLAQIQKTLNDMQSNLHDNINKVGVALVKSIATANPSSPVASVYSSNSLVALWAKLYGSARDAHSSYM